MCVFPRRRFAEFLLLSVIAGAARAGTLYVDVGLTSGANDGTSWANAFQSATGLQAALAAAVSGDEIWVARGTYNPTATATRTIHFDLKEGVAIYGGFVGGESSVNQSDWKANETILSGDLAGDDDSGQFGDNSTHIVRGSNVGATAVLDGFTVTGGNANLGPGDDHGGGFYMFPNGGATIRNCWVKNNRCTFAGGAAVLGADHSTWTDVVFENNDGGNSGGAVLAANNVVFTRCVFRGNTAANGGGLSISGLGSGVQVRDCLFIGNAASAVGLGGGAIWAATSAPVIRGSTIVANFSFSSIVAAAGIYCTPQTTVANCIVYFNTGPGGAQGTANQISTNQITNAAVSYSCVQGGIAGIGNISADPLLHYLPGGDLTLAPASPCIDAGNNAAVPTGTTLDLAGNPRFADDQSVADTGAGTAPIVDIGAYEGANTLYTPFCFGDGSLATACPCGNAGSAGHGCQNSNASSTGAALSARGTASPDTVVLTATELLPTVLCVFVQGNATVIAGAVFGDGVRCVGGSLKRIATKNASGGAASYPGSGDLALSDQSAALGDPITPGSIRYYQVYYRDPDLSFCSNPPGNSFNVSSGVILQW